MTPQLWSTLITSQIQIEQMTLVMLGPLTIYSPLPFFLILANLKPYGVHFLNRFHHWNQHDETVTMVTSLHYFFYVIFFPFFRHR